MDAAPRGDNGPRARKPRALCVLPQRAHNARRSRINRVWRGRRCEAGDPMRKGGHARQRGPHGRLNEVRTHLLPHLRDRTLDPRRQWANPRPQREQLHPPRARIEARGPQPRFGQSWVGWRPRIEANKLGMEVRPNLGVGSTIVRAKLALGPTTQSRAACKELPRLMSTNVGLVPTEATQVLAKSSRC